MTRIEIEISIQHLSTNLKRISSLWLWFILSICTISAQNTYYVSLNGSDTNPGTNSQPFRNITKAAQLMQAGDNCLIRAGVYRETVVLSNKGTEGAPIVFANYPGEQVIISGTDIIQGWIKVEGNLWKAATDAPISQLFINGKRGIPARYPNQHLSMYDKLSWAKVTTKADKTGTMSGLEAFGDLKGSQIVALGKNNWVCVNGTIISNNGASFSVNKTDIFWSNIAPESFLGEGRGFVTGNLKLLDSPGEWHFENKELFLIPPEQTNPNNLQIEGRKRKLGFDLTNAEYISLSGLHFKAASLSLREAIACRIENCSFRYPTPFFHFSNGFNRNDTVPENWEGNGVEVSGRNNLIRDCYVAHSWGDGLTVWGNSNKVDNCIIEDCNWLNVDSAPISVTGEGHTISNNTLRISGRNILVHRYLKQGHITNNNMHHSGMIANDLGITYAYDTDGDNTEISYNWIHDNMAENSGFGIYLDNWNSNYFVHHNAVWNCHEGIRLNLPQINTRVYNNTFWNNEIQMGSWGPNGTEMINCQVWNNIQDHETFIGNDQRNNLFATASMFVNSEKCDFRLLSDAKAIDFGIEIPGFTDGYAGNSPDAGAYELGNSWTAGSSISIPLFDDSMPSLVSDFSGRADTGKIILFWDSLSINITWFAIDRKEPDKAFEEIALLSSNNFTYSDTSVQLAVDYIYRLRTVNKNGSSIIPDYLQITSLGNVNLIKIQAEDYTEESGIINFGTYIGGCDDGDYIILRQVDFGKGFNTFTAMLGVPPEFAGKYIELYIGSPDSIMFAHLQTRSTGSWSPLETQSVLMDSTITGLHDIYILFKGGYGVGNFDWFVLENRKREPLVDVSLKTQKHQNKIFATPNPFEAKTELRFQLNQAGPVSIQIYDLFGRLIKSLNQEYNAPGECRFQLDLTGFPKQAYILKLIYNRKLGESIMLIHK